MAKVRFKIKEEIRIRVASNQSVLLRGLLLPAAVASLPGAVGPFLGLAFGIPPYIKNGYYQKRVRKKERLSVYLTER